MSLRRILIIPTLWCIGFTSVNTQTLPIASSSGTATDATQQPGIVQQQETPDGPELTLAGCLMRHQDVPAKANAPAADRSMNHDGYILVDATTVAHHKGVNGMRPTAPVAAAPHDHASIDTTPTVSPTANVADSQMFKIEGLGNEELEAFAGKRVTLMGDLIADGDGQRMATAVLKDTAHDAAPFKATMIHPASGTCRQ